MIELALSFLAKTAIGFLDWFYRRKDIRDKVKLEIALESEKLANKALLVLTDDSSIDPRVRDSDGRIIVVSPSDS